LLPAEKSKCTAKEEKTILGHLTKFIKMRQFWETIYQSLFKIKRETALATGFVKNLAFLNTSFPKKVTFIYLQNQKGLSDTKQCSYNFVITLPFQKGKLASSVVL